ncbi:head-tail connector protein [Sphingomonas sp. Xoc002]|uniref:head-tail connector protein n=1 Tax=Sphingomonas sp. Xoc002 TaxID=2837624 RepID=UPI003D16D5FD
MAGITLDEAKRQLRLTPSNTSQDEEIKGFLADAQAWVTGYTGFLFSPQAVTEKFRVPGRRIELRSWPVKPGAIVTVSYPDTNGNPAIFQGAQVQFDAGRVSLTLPSGRGWPLSDTSQSLTITTEAGLPDGVAVPGEIRRALLMLIGAYDDDREGGDTIAKAEATARRLCRRFRQGGL